MDIDVSAVTSHFPNPQDGFTTTTSGSVSSGAATVGLNSTGNYDNGDIVVLIIDPADANKKQVFVGTIDTGGVQVTNVVWVGGTNQSHQAGATVVDYMDAAHIKMMTKGIRVSLNQDGTIKNGAVSLAAMLASNVVTTSKILDDAVTGAKIQLDNNENLEALNSSGTAKSLARLDNDDYLRLAQLPRSDDGSASTLENVLIQHGWGWQLGDNTSAMSEAVTFPAAYSSPPVVIVGPLGQLSGSDPNSVDDFNSLSGAYAQAFSITNSGFSASIVSRDSATNLATTVRYGYSWVAIGVKA